MDMKRKEQVFLSQFVVCLFVGAIWSLPTTSKVASSLDGVPQLLNNVNTLLETRQLEARSLQLQNSRRGGALGGRLKPSDGSSNSRKPVNGGGFPCEDSALVEEAGVKCKLLARDLGPLGCQRILSELTEERGLSVESIPPAFRSRRIADACPETCGLCKECSPGCAVWFIANMFCEPECDNGPCQYDGGDCWETDCAVSNWGEWGDCSVTCAGPGLQTRSRRVVVSPSTNGQQCPDSLEESKKGCNEGVLCPVACAVSQWSAWSPCSADCGMGQNKRSREVVSKALYGGSDCPSLSQSRDCFEAMCVTNCTVSDWGSWSDCSSACGEGERTRRRRIETPPTLDGGLCPSLEEAEVCNGFNCGEPCLFSLWSDWTPCSATCDGGTMKRSRSLKNQPADGVLCPPLEESLFCNTFGCSRNCEVEDWSAWSTCDKDCGLGVQRRSRARLVEAENLGRPCGTLAEERPCFNQICAQGCVLDEWGSWSSCSVTCGTGVEIRTKSVLMPPTDGTPCDEVFESRTCDQEPCVNEICVISSEFNDWSDCEDSCQTVNTDPASLISFRARRIELQSPACPSAESLIETKRCSAMDFKCAESAPEDCVVSEWGIWRDCSATCGGGERSRERSITFAGTSTGKPCPPLVDTQECSGSNCPINCLADEWSGWGLCSASCGQGVRERSRGIKTPASDDPPGLPCSDLTQTAVCFGAVCDKACEVSLWTDWGACSALCGRGEMMRTRVIVEPSYGGAPPCPVLFDVSPCNQEACATPCEVTEWTDWSSCNVSCGSGNQGLESRTRSVLISAEGTGSPCPVLDEQRPCGSVPSCPIDCEMADWTSWSGCLADCGRGVEERYRIVLQESAHGGVPCGPLEDERDCLVDPPCVIDCLATDWTAWTECSASCNGGETLRTRTILARPANGGKPCDSLLEAMVCNEYGCGDAQKELDCQLGDWSDWDMCMRSGIERLCGGGVHSRKRSILVASLC
eukprot:GHVN01019179.1.p1 GENE.GHVN01019179.1~~GHVN01019179.1.p1  ORF type:complete len:977 (+),score=72.94 GHVN01019179.1:1725-4655(+)